MTDWLRQYFPYYAQISALLQAWKAMLLKNAPEKENARKSYADKTHIDDPTKEKKKSFQAIQANFLELSFLFHLDSERPIYADVDSSKVYGHGAIIYQVKGDSDLFTIIKDGKAEHFSRNSIQPILFLSKLLSAVEKNYWPTELKVAGLV